MKELLTIFFVFLVGQSYGQGEVKVKLAVGTYYLRYGEENTIDKGKYINIWKNENGEWKIYSNIWNSNLPME